MNHDLRILCAQRRAIRFLLARGLATSGLCRFLTIKQRGYRLRFHRSNLSEQLWLDPASRQEGLEFFRAYGDNVIDVGRTLEILRSLLR